MQITNEVLIVSNIVTIALSALLAAYLFSKWYSQERRLSTDLPLMFAITFVGQAVNNLIRLLPSVTAVPDSLDLFRLRALVIVVTAFPLLVVVMHIWFPRLRRHYSKLVGLMLVYWVSVSLFVTAPTDLETRQLIVMLNMPIILLLTIGMIVTFSITWKTGRLKEVRSDLMVLSFILGIFSQIVATQVLLNNLLTALATVTATIALTNPFGRGRRAPAGPRPQDADPQL